MADSTEHPYSPKFDPYFTAIGRVANAYSQLEFKMNDAIWELANVARMAGVCMTAQMIGPGPRNRCLVALLKFRNASDALIKEFNKIGDKIEGVAARRNRYVHDPFVLLPDTGEIRRMESTANKSISYGFKDADINDLKQLATDIDTPSRGLNCRYWRGSLITCHCAEPAFSLGSPLVVQMRTFQRLEVLDKAAPLESRWI